MPGMNGILYCTRTLKFLLRDAYCARVQCIAADLLFHTPTAGQVKVVGDCTKVLQPCPSIARGFFHARTYLGVHQTAMIHEEGLYSRFHLSSRLLPFPTSRSSKLILPYMNPLCITATTRVSTDKFPSSANIEPGPESSIAFALVT
jgi:hypothetical protein